MADQQRTHVVKVRREIVNREYGHWCADCSLPSGMRVHVAVWLNKAMHLQTHLICDDCEGTNITLNETTGA